MPATSTESPSRLNYCFLMKCLAGVALFGFIIAMLSKPTYIIATTAATLAPMAASAVFFPFTALLTLTAMIALFAVVASVLFTSSPITPLRPIVAPWYTPAYWFGPRYASLGWVDYMFNWPTGYNLGSRYSTIHDRNFHGHENRMPSHHHSMFQPSSNASSMHAHESRSTARDTHSASFSNAGHHHGHR